MEFELRKRWSQEAGGDGNVRLAEAAYLGSRREQGFGDVGCERRGLDRFDDKAPIGRVWVWNHTR